MTVSTMLIIPSALADGHLEGAIKARKSVMQLYAHSLGILGAMAKGEAEYDAAQAAAAANNLKAVANLDQSSIAGIILDQQNLSSAVVSVHDF